ncbi:mannose-6-phosphate isomerase isoform X3 [Polyergus mexicanus]|uniref:mannose-6-phosphate isomerase isoform X3 n=1 Tax=Polyergus mexicanus TaxID=615972 RepID=UPI0038B6597F
MELKCAIQTYNWGKHGMDSIVATLMKSANADFVVDEQKTYAELWMGTHENGPSYLKDIDVPLQKYIQENTKVLGSDTIQMFGSNLPFLFKVLSINKALSIQVHPNKATDSMISDALRQCFYSLMTCDSNEVARQLKNLIDRLHNIDDSYRQWIKADLLKRLHADYPGDVGCFTIYLFNYITMQPGEAIYIGPNIPHAYLSGDCIECMACSDNVIRAGLTPKPKDVPTLIQILSFECELASARKIQPFREDVFTEVFRPPVPEFAVAKITLPPGRPLHNLKHRNSASILLIVSGKAEISSKIFSRGSVLFIPANEVVEIKVLCGCHPMLMFQAFPNV